MKSYSENASSFKTVRNSEVIKKSSCGWQFAFCSVVMTVDGTSNGRTDNVPRVWKGIAPSLGSVMSLAVLTCCPRLKEGSSSDDNIQ